jgi:mRNA interferase RelE/StbE
VTPEPYTVELSAHAQRQFDKLPLSVQGRILPKLQALVSVPRPSGCKKLEGASDLYRIRVGDYRVIYEVQDERLLILVIEVGHRREIYR